jgi:hypothetical protein
MRSAGRVPVALGEGGHVRLALRWRHHRVGVWWVRAFVAGGHWVVVVLHHRVVRRVGIAGLGESLIRLLCRGLLWLEERQNLRVGRVRLWLALARGVVDIGTCATSSEVDVGLWTIRRTWLSYRWAKLMGEKDKPAASKALIMSLWPFLTAWISGVVPVWSENVAAK